MDSPSKQVHEGSNNNNNDSSIGFGMKMTLKGIKSKFSSVNHHVSICEAIDKLSTGTSGIPLFDIREEKEFKVSHIKHAHWIDSRNKLEEQADILLNKMGTSGRSEAIVYCSVGYRSSELIQFIVKHKQTEAEKLKLINMEGGIFQWANEGNVVINTTSGGECAVVHPYNAVFGKLLSSKLRFSDTN